MLFPPFDGFQVLTTELKCAEGLTPDVQPFNKWDSVWLCQKTLPRHRARRYLCNTEIVVGMVSGSRGATIECG